MTREDKVGIVVIILMVIGLIIALGLSARYADIQDSTCYIEGCYGSGSGFVYSYEGDLVVITAGHVVSGCNDFTLRWQGYTEYNANKVYMSDEYDLAIIDIPDNIDISPLCVADIDMSIGDSVIICGCPFGEELAYTVSYGYISGLDRDIPLWEGTDLLQADAQSWPGNSGGPVMHNGKVIGVLVGGMRMADGISLIVPSEYIIEMFQDEEFADTW